VYLFIFSFLSDFIHEISFPSSYVKQNTIYNVWRNTINLRDSVNMKRIMVQHFQQELRLYNILKEQVHSRSLLATRY
jgi:hypothetical protein